ncbi:MAG: hypothetical protein ACLP5V_05205 [Candidatus Bathyarchaeia archaeon]
MKFIDRAFGATLLAFALGSLAGAVLIAFFTTFGRFMAFLLTSRAIAPLRAATTLGGTAVTLLVFLNNCVPVLLSFLYPAIIAKVRWEPPIRDATRSRLLAAFSLLAGGLIGFFDLGSTLMLASEIGGWVMVSRLLATSWIHAPLEFLFVLICVAEPLRIARERTAGKGIIGSLRGDLRLLFISLLGLLVSAIIEVIVGL